MLNELYSMAQSLDRCKQKVTATHKLLTKSPKEDGFILGIDQDGLVESVEFVPKDKVKEIWKIDGEDNLSGFPSFSITEPLYEPNSSDNDRVEQLTKLKKEDVSTRLRLIEEILVNSKLACGTNQKRRFQKNLRDFPEKLKEIFAESPPEYLVIVDVLDRLCESTLSEEQFVAALSDAGVRAFARGRFTAEAGLVFQNLLFGKWDKKKSRFVGAKTVVVLESAGGVKYPYAISHPNTEQFVNLRLTDRLSGKSFTKGGKGSLERSGVDSMLGVQTELETRFPSPKLPILGITKLMSMTKDSLCQTRYTLQESATFPVGKGTTQAMVNALKFLTKEEREGKTWRGVPNAEEKGKDLLLVYLEDNPDMSASLADYFALDTGDDLSGEAQFEATAEKVCAALEGNPAIRPDSLLRVIVLSSRDKGRKQIALSECFQVKEIFQSAEQWRKAGSNLPLVSVLLPPKKNEKQRVVSPACPHPAALLKCFNTQWTNEGTKSSWISSCDLGQIYEFFFRQSARSQATTERLLTLALQRNSSLLLALGNRQHGGNWSGFPDKSRFVSLTSVSALAILLFKTGHKKEEFMKQAPFNIGRLLSLADQLHALYCKEVRGGDVPRQLFGNALMNTALQQPVTAFALFGQRILPYWAWADTVNSGEKVGLARYFLKEIRAVSQTISESTIPATLSDAERAEMILGYLANSRAENKENQ